MFPMLKPHMPLHAANISFAAEGLRITGSFTQLVKDCNYSTSVRIEVGAITVRERRGTVENTVDMK